MVTAETAPLVRYLKADLQRIVNSANEELKNIRCAGLVDSTRQAEEARVMDEARAFALRRVESTVRHLHTMKSKSPTGPRPVNGVDEAVKTTRFKLAPPLPPPPGPPPPPPRRDPDPESTTQIPVAEVPAPASPATFEARHEQPPDPFQPWEPVEPERPDEKTDRLEPAAHALPEPEPEAVEPEAAAPEIAEPEQSAPKHAFDSDDTEVLEGLATLLQEIAPLPEPPAEPPPPVPTPPPAAPQPPVDDTEVTRRLPAAAPAEPAEAVEPAEPAESDRERLERVLKFVARQEPGLRWAVGMREDGSTLLVTDLAHGWIPPGIDLPADIQLLEPSRRTGTAATLLGRTTPLATYAPGDPLGWSTDYEVADTSSQPRQLPAVDDLGWVLGEATHWRDGLPRMINTLAKAGAAGTGIVDAEIDILRVYLDTSRYQLLAQYPDVDPGLLLNCLLLAATESIATRNVVSANYHFAWFQLLSSPLASGWKAGP